MKKLEVILFVAVFVFMFIECYRIYDYFVKNKSEKEIDYLIVLGAETFGTEPGIHLKKRLDKAIEIINENPHITVIVSGGNPQNNELSEAEIMKRYISNNILESITILTEENSRNTYENFLFSKELIKQETACVGIVTNSYHMFRAMRTAKTVGIKNTTPIYAPSVKIYLPYNVIREITALIIYFWRNL